MTKIVWLAISFCGFFVLAQALPPIITYQNGCGFTCQPCTRRKQYGKLKLPNLIAVHEHIKDSHPDYENRFVCPICSSKYTSLVKMRTHMENYDRFEKRGPDYNPVQDVRCKLCNAVLPMDNFKTDFLVHALNVHKKELNLMDRTSRVEVFGPYSYLLPNAESEKNDSRKLKRVENPVWPNILSQVLLIKSAHLCRSTAPEMMFSRNSGSLPSSRDSRISVKQEDSQCEGESGMAGKRKGQGRLGECSKRRRETVTIDDSEEEEAESRSRGGNQFFNSGTVKMKEVITLSSSDEVEVIQQKTPAEDPFRKRKLKAEEVIRKQEVDVVDRKPEIDAVDMELKIDAVVRKPEVDADDGKVETIVRKRRRGRKKKEDVLSTSQQNENFEEQSIKRKGRQKIVNKEVKTDKKGKGKIKANTEKKRNRGRKKGRKNFVKNFNRRIRIEERAEENSWKGATSSLSLDEREFSTQSETDESEFIFQEEDDKGQEDEETASTEDEEEIRMPVGGIHKKNIQAFVEVSENTSDKHPVEDTPVELKKDPSSHKGKEKIEEKEVTKTRITRRKMKPSVRNSRLRRRNHQKKDAHTSESEEYTGESDYAPTRQVNISQIRRSSRIKQKEEGKMSAVTDGNPCRGLEGTEIHVGDGEVKEVDGKVAEGKAGEIMKDDAVVTNEIVTEEMAKVMCNANDIACGIEKIKITDVDTKKEMASEADENKLGTAEETIQKGKGQANDTIEMETAERTIVEMGTGEQKVGTPEETIKLKTADETIEAGLVKIRAEETEMYEGAEEEQSTSDVVKDKGKEIEQSDFDDIDWRGFNDTIVFGGIATLKHDRQPNEEASSSQATAEEPPSTLSSLSTVLEEGKDHETTIIEEFPSTDLGYDYETIYKEEWPGAPTDYMMDFLHIDEIPADYGDEFFDYDHLTRELVAELLKEKGILRPLSYPERPDPPKTPMMDLNIMYID